jgi:hypothetical protein
MPDSVDAVTPIKVDAYARRTGCSVSERYAFHAVQSIVPQPRRPKQFIATHGSGQSTVPRIRVFFHKVAAHRNPFDMNVLQILPFSTPAREDRPLQCGK